MTKNGAQAVTVQTATGQKLAYPWATSLRVDRRGDLHRFMKRLEGVQHQRAVGSREGWTQVLVRQSDVDQAVGFVIRIFQGLYLLEGLVKLISRVLMTAALKRHCRGIDKPTRHHRVTLRGLGQGEALRISRNSFLVLFLRRE